MIVLRKVKITGISPPMLRGLKSLFESWDQQNWAYGLKWYDIEHVLGTRFRSHESNDDEKVVVPRPINGVSHNGEFLYKRSLKIIDLELTSSEDKNFTAKDLNDKFLALGVTTNIYSSLSRLKLYGYVIHGNSPGAYVRTSKVNEFEQSP